MIGLAISNFRVARFGFLWLPMTSAWIGLAWRCDSKIAREGREKGGQVHVAKEELALSAEAPLSPGGLT